MSLQSLIWNNTIFSLESIFFTGVPLFEVLQRQASLQTKIRLDVFQTEDTTVLLLAIVRCFRREKTSPNTNCGKISVQAHTTPTHLPKSLETQAG